VRHRTLTALAVVATLVTAMVASGGTASAGGSNWSFDRDHYQPGESAFAWASVSWAHNPSLGTPEEGPYEASLVSYPESGPSQDQPILESAVRVGPITVSLEPYGTGPIRFGPHHVEIRFTVPDLPPGRYQLLHANAAGKSIGDVTMGMFWIDARAVRASPRFTG
jgi:hypothetical protein